jgi:hypothetical protein
MTPQLFSLMNSTRTILARHHPVLFITALCLLLGAGVYSLYEVLSITSTTGGTSSIVPFDQKTIDKIKSLHSSTDSNNTALTFPTPRSNPFVE